MKAGEISSIAPVESTSNLKIKGLRENQILVDEGPLSQGVLTPRGVLPLPNTTKLNFDSARKPDTTGKIRL